MLPKQHRLPLRTELKRVQKEGKLIHGQLFSLLVATQLSINDGLSRFGFIISSKVHKKAVKRNRAGRLLNEAIQSLLPALKPGFDGVFLARKTIVDKNLNEIKKEVERIFRKGGLISQKETRVR